MQKIKFILTEFFRSFRNNVFKNILLICMFSISLVMTVLMSSYYLDLGELSADSIHNIKNGTWYDVSTYDDHEEFCNSFSTVKGCQNMMSYYERIHNSKDNPMLSVDTQQGMNVREEDFIEYFADKEYKRFCHIDHPEPFIAYWGTYGDRDKQCSVLELKFAQLDFRAYQIFGLKTEKGIGFTKDNLTIQKASDAIPIILGNEYEGIIPIGKVLEINMSGTEYIYLCKVVGILQRGSQIPNNGNPTQDMISLDSYIIFPFGIHLLDNNTKIEEIQRYAFWDYWTFNTSRVYVADDHDFKQLVTTFQRIGQEYRLPPVRLGAASIGLDLLRKESEASVRILLVLTIALLCFTFYGLFISFYDKIQSNKRTYGIYLMNGCSLHMILLPCLFELIVILFPAIFACRYVFTNDNVGSGANIEVILGTAYSLVGIAFIIGAIYFMFLMRGVDTEHLIRQKD